METLLLDERVGGGAPRPEEIRGRRAPPAARLRGHEAVGNWLRGGKKDTAADGCWRVGRALLRGDRTAGEGTRMAGEAEGQKDRHCFRMRQVMRVARE